ncbi:hypothetical protein PPH41_05285, partial [Burkholderia gladioli]|nr:hypothetical protein [Burkholderia gladioli]
MALTNSIEDKLDRGFTELRRTGRRVARDARHNAHNLNADVKDDVRSLVEELEDLLKKEDADVESLRKRLHGRLAEVQVAEHLQLRKTHVDAIEVGARRAGAAAGCWAPRRRSSRRRTG